MGIFGVNTKFYFCFYSSFLRHLNFFKPPLPVWGVFLYVFFFMQPPVCFVLHCWSSKLICTELDFKLKALGAIAVNKTVIAKEIEVNIKLQLILKNKFYHLVRYFSQWIHTGISLIEDLKTSRKIWCGNFVLSPKNVSLVWKRGNICCESNMFLKH